MKDSHMLGKTPLWWFVVVPVIDIEPRKERTNIPGV